MKKQELIDLGVSAEIADKVLVLHGKDIEGHKTKITAAEGERDQFKTQLDAANQQIESFKGMKKPEEVDAAVNEWKTKAEQAQTEAQKQILSIKRNNALEKHLKETYKVKDVKSVKAHLDDEKIQFNEKDETFVGLDEQVKPVKEKHDYLFEGEKPAPKIITGGNNKPIQIDPIVAAMRKGAGLSTSDNGEN
jgi:hypothetical protein